MSASSSSSHLALPLANSSRPFFLSHSRYPGELRTLVQPFALFVVVAPLRWLRLPPFRPHPGRHGLSGIPLITEVFGGISPQPARFLRQLSRVAAKHTTQDRTKYTRCARSYRTYHGQCISHAIVITDAHHIGEEIHNFKKQRLSRGGA